jgi:hypothetical protein
MPVSSRSSAALWTGALALVVLAAIRHAGVLTAGHPLPDEGVYLDAFARLRGGHSPYDASGYYYAPVFAWAGAKLVDARGELGALGVLRAANLVGVAAAAWIAAGAIRRASPCARAVVAAGLLLLAPPLATSLGYGNLSGAAGGAVLIALAIWPSRPRLAGLLFALGLAVKPLAGMALLAIALFRSDASTAEAHARARRWTLASTAAATLALLAPGREHLRGWLLHAPTGHDRRSASLVHVLDLLGARVPPLVIALAVAAACTVVLRARPRTPEQVGFVAGAASVLAAPLVWDHTLVLALPIAVALVDERLRDRASAPPAERPRALLALLVSALACLVLAGTRDWTELVELPDVASALLGLVPLATLGLVTRFVVARRAATAAPSPRALLEP